LDSALSKDSPFGNLLGQILSTPENPDEIGGLGEVLADLREKIPSEAFSADSVLNLDEKECIRRLVEEAKHLLAGRLLSSGGAK
jgi:hypothetical protein